MVVEPVDDRDKKVEENNRLNTSAGLQKQKIQAADAETKKRIVPSLNNIAHNPFYNFFQTEQVKPGEVKTSFESSRLNKIDPNVEMEIFGKVYQKKDLTENINQILDQFLTEIDAEHTSEVIANLKKLPPELQVSIINSLLDKVGKPEDGFVNYVKGLFGDTKILDLLQLVISDNAIMANFSREQRAAILGKVSEKEIPGLLRLGIDWINTVKDIGKVVYGEIEEKIKVLTDDTRVISSLTAKLNQEEKITAGDLVKIQQKADKARLTVQHARLAVAQLKAKGETEQATELENNIIIMEQAVNEL